MARPQQEILLSIQDDEHLTVIDSQGLWAVLYKNKPVNIRKTHWIVGGESYKYFKMVYPNPAGAYRLADKLNATFNCSDFTAVKIL